MTNANIREVHKLLDSLFDNSELSHAQIELIRGLVPELPKQKTLAEIIAHVDDAWSVASDNDWGGNSYDPDVSIEDWLWELYEQLKGLKDTPAAVPALPAGMRIAEHENFGRVIVSPGVGIDRCHEIFYLDPGMSSGTDIGEVEPDSLTFIGSEPGHPEFLETEADYENAPEGTIVAKDDISTAWIKRFGAWKSTDGDRGVRCPNWKVGHRIILRWGWKK